MIRFIQSSIGKKWIVALTGLVLIAYVLGHLAGNLQIFLPDGQEYINRYAHFLHSLGGALWAIRAFLLACFAAHICATVQLAMENRAARPDRYAVVTPVKQRLSTRIMVVSGLIILCFVAFHILHFTTRTAVAAVDAAYQAEVGPNNYHNVYAMVITGFQNPLASGFYIVGMVLLCSHLSHAFSSVLQTLSINNNKASGVLVRAGQLLAWVICAGYISIPVAVMTGLLKIK